MTVLSLLAYLMTEQFDWQLNKSVYRTHRGTITTAQPFSAPEECTTISRQQIQAQLKEAKNAFAAVENIGLGPSTLCLPPYTSMEIKSNSVTLATRVCRIVFAVKEPFAYTSHMSPDTNIADLPMLPDGTPRFSITAYGIRATVEFFALRAQDRELTKYQDWTKRVVDGAKIWFEGAI